MAVRKTYFAGFERFLERERFVHKEYGGKRSEVPPLLDEGDNYIVRPYYENECDLYRRRHGLIVPRVLLPIHVARAAMDFLRFMNSEGFALFDYHPGNIVYSMTSGLKAIDFEYLHPYTERPPEFRSCWAIAGVPDDFSGDLPESWPADNCPYDAKWLPYVGLDLESLLRDPLWKQQMRRLLFQCRKLFTVHLERAARHLIRLRHVNER